MRQKNVAGFLFSLVLHGAFCAFLLWNGISFFREPIEEVPPCSIPLEVMEVSEISQAPISMPKEEEPDHQEKKREENPPLENSLPAPPPQEQEKVPAEEKKESPEPRPEKEEKTPIKEEQEKKSPEEKDPDIDSLLQDVKKKEKPPLKKPSEKKPSPQKAPLKKPAPPKNSPKKKSPAQKGQPNKENDEEDFIKMLKNLDHDKKGPSASTPITDKDSTSRYGAAAVGPHMSMSYMDRVRRVLEGAWRVPIRAKENGTLIIVVELEMNPDGSIAHVQVLHGEGTPQHPTYELGVQNVLEALDSPRCNPLPLPKDRYSEWKKFKFRFMPK